MTKLSNHAAFGESLRGHIQGKGIRRQGPHRQHTLQSSRIHDLGDNGRCQNGTAMLKVFRLRSFTYQPIAHSSYPAQLRWRIVRHHKIHGDFI